MTSLVPIFLSTFHQHNFSTHLPYKAQTNLHGTLTQKKHFPLLLQQPKMCTLETRGNTFFLTLTGPTEHRLSPTLISDLRVLLNQIRIQSQSKPGSVLITTGDGKFFSNGFDLTWAQSTGPQNFRSNLTQMVTSFAPLIADLISLPLPTIAAGFILAIAHDYVFMRKDRGVLYMSELDIGMTLPDYIADFMREKMGWRNLRDVVLRGEMLKGEDAARRGIVDGVFESGEEVVEKAVKLGEDLGRKGWNGDVYREIRKSTLKGVLPVLGLREEVVVLAKL